MARQEDEIARLLVPLPRFVEPVLGQFQSCRTVELLPDSGAQRREIHRSSRSQSPRARSRGVGQRVPFPLRDVAAWLVENRLRSGTPGPTRANLLQVPRRLWPLLVSDKETAVNPPELPGARTVSMRDHHPEEADLPQLGWNMAG